MRRLAGWGGASGTCSLLSARGAIPLVPSMCSSQRVLCSGFRSISTKHRPSSISWLPCCLNDENWSTSFVDGTPICESFGYQLPYSEFFRGSASGCNVRSDHESQR